MPNAKKYIIITSIFPPNEAIIQYAEMEGWDLVVVGDRKTPDNWQYENVTYLSPKDQVDYGYAIAEVLPWNHYCRKMIGYLYAMEQGAEIIIDTDDDNIPKPKWGFPVFDGPFRQFPKLSGFVNIYKYFTDMTIWPRGFPLQYLNGNAHANELPLTDNITRIGIWQGLADGNPDVDAIYRLTNDTPCFFKDEKPIVLSEGTICPFNSQNTAFRREVFPLLYLPSHVTFRFTDILRGLVAQPILWAAGYNLGFSSATVLQERNPHDYLKDFESEIPCYLYAERAIDLVKEIVSPDVSLTENLQSAYKTLSKNDLVPPEEEQVITAWLRDMAAILG